jgi:hypothetical protein
MNIVLSFATNMSPERIKAFAYSLREIYSPQECDLVIFTDKTDESLDELAEQLNLTFVFTESQYSLELSKFSKLLIRLTIYPMRWLSKNFSFNQPTKLIFKDLYQSMVKLWGHPQLIRWLYFREFLRLNKKYKKVLISDIKYVIFQDHFFSRLEEDTLYLTEQGLNFGAGHWDTRWYKQAFGMNALEKVKGKPALCCALVAGGRIPVVQFLDSFCAGILDRPVGSTVDQAIFNHCYYSTDFSTNRIQLLKNDGQITFHAINPKQVQEEFNVTENGVVTQNSKLVPIIHGWDRNEAIFEYVSDRYKVPGAYGYKGGFIGKKD